MSFSHPDYTLIRELGHGGSASVHLAVQKSLERRVAIKILHAAVLRSPRAGARFLREARTVAMLVHPHIVPVFEVGRQPDEFGYFMTMEYLPGGTLGTRRASMTLGELLRAIEQTSAALACAHAEGFVHRDVKADNILFRTNGEAVLTDFGIARLTESLTHMTVTGSVLGTAAYMSPEQVRGETLDGRSDLYSLGIVLYEMLAGRRPFVGDSIVSTGLQHVTTPPPSLDADHAPFRPLVERLLAKAPEERLPDAAALRHELARLRERLSADLDVPLTTWRVKGAAMARHERAARAPHRVPGSRVAARPTGAARRAPRAGARFTALAAALVGVVAVGVVGRLDDTSSTDPMVVPGTRVEPPDTVIRSSDAPPSDAPVVPPSDSAAVLDAEPAVSPPDTTGAVISALDAAAERAYLDDRWFGDSADTAVALSRRVLVLDADEPAASRRLERVWEATRRQAEAAIARGEFDTAGARIDALERYWPTRSGTVVALRESLAESRARREAAARLAERRRRGESALIEAERALLDGSLEQADEQLATAAGLLPGDERTVALAARLDAARERAAEAARARLAAERLRASIDALAERFDVWSSDENVRLDDTWESLDRDLRALLAENPDSIALRRLVRVAERQAGLLARAEESVLAPAETVEPASDRFHLPGF